MRSRLLPWLLAIVACAVSSTALAGVIMLFENQNLGGARLVLRNEMPNLDQTDFNDRTESILVREGYWEICTDAYYRGYWLFCTDANFQGTCRTFGPGQYPQLPWDVANKISSGRPIHDQYPYNAPPAWQR